MMQISSGGRRGIVMAVILAALGLGIFVARDTSNVPGDSGAAVPNTLYAKSWTWVNTHMNDGSVTVPAKEDAFTVKFGADGIASFTTDCNSMSATYETGDSRLVFGPIASTKMYCEGSQEGEFARKIAEVQSYLFHEGLLVLEIKYDSGTMTFR